jgi:hypothetical protein
VGSRIKPTVQKSMRKRAQRWGEEDRFNHHILRFIGKELLDGGITSVNGNIEDNFVSIAILSIGCEI